MLIYKIRYIENNFPVEKFFEFFNRIGRSLTLKSRIWASPLEKIESIKWQVNFAPAVALVNSFAVVFI